MIIIIIQISIFLWVALSIVLGLFSALHANREDRAYRQVFIWFMSPFISFVGLIFLEKSRKKSYFNRLKSDLFIKP
jgi:hypothetical protein